MNAVITLSKNDFRSTFRDPVFKGMLFFPLASFAIVYWGLPALQGAWPAVEPYKQVVLMWACLQSSTMFGFIYGFLFLEEKEDNIWQAIRVLPVKGMTLVFSRLLAGIIISMLVNFLLIYFGNIIFIPLYKALLLAFLFSLSAPLIALWLGAMAKNKIEGLAQMKILNIFLILPGLIYILPYKAFTLTALVPTYWAFKSVEYSVFEGNNFWLFFAVGVLFHLLVIYLLNLKLQKSIN
jgi:fluoroquinolone transport system permease protein